MNVKTFISDLLKSWIVGAIIGAAVFSYHMVFISFGKFAWLYAFAAVVIFELLLTFVYPVVIMPLFNKFTPLEDGELKIPLKSMRKENFKMKGLFKMDNSKRSSKSNAFFAGFGKFRRIVLFDTLIENILLTNLQACLPMKWGILNSDMLSDR